MGDLDASVPVGAPRPRLAQPLAPDSAAVASSGGGRGAGASCTAHTEQRAGSASLHRYSSRNACGVYFTFSRGMNEAAAVRHRLGLRT